MAPASGSGKMRAVKLAEGRAFTCVKLSADRAPAASPLVAAASSLYPNRSCMSQHVCQGLIMQD